MPVELMIPNSRSTENCAPNTHPIGTVATTATATSSNRRRGDLLPKAAMRIEARRPRIARATGRSSQPPSPGEKIVSAPLSTAAHTDQPSPVAGELSHLRMIAHPSHAVPSRTDPQVTSLRRCATTAPVTTMPRPTTASRRRKRGGSATIPQGGVISTGGADSSSTAPRSVPRRSCVRARVISP